MSFYTCFDWFKKLRLFSYVPNLKLDVVFKASCYNNYIMCSFHLYIHFKRLTCDFEIETSSVNEAHNFQLWAVVIVWLLDLQLPVQAVLLFFSWRSKNVPSNEHGWKIVRFINSWSFNFKLRCIGLKCLIVWLLDLQLPVQAVPSTANFMGSNPVYGEMYSIQHYVIKFVGDLWQVGGFLYHKDN
jgi:hypothetical protein